ncbi:MAG: NTPase KAP [Nitrospirae bacterium]|nr:NTPase KAP [Candidatus Manganitrophaceae bacterium]
MLIPDHETAVDFLNYEAVSKTVVELLKDNRQRALTIGIHGDWGAGKSSVLKMVESAMAGDKEVACLWFNGWAFQGFDDAKTVLIEVIISELCRQRSAVGKVKEISKGLLKRVDWLKLARRGGSLAFTLATGLPPLDQISTVMDNIQSLAGSVKSMSPADIETKLTEAASFLKSAEERSVPDQIHNFRKEFAKLLEEAKIDQLVVLIDDLDRCLPATAIDTLEAIRLFLFVPKTAFVIGADEGMIEYAVRQHFPNLPLGSGGVPYTRNYLEKLIQVPFRIPALGVQESRAYVTLLLVQALVGEDHVGFKTLLAKARKSLNQPWLGGGISQADVRAVDPTRHDVLDAAFVLTQQIGPILAEGTKGNPRQIKRFLNSLSIRLTIAKERGFQDSMNPAALGKLMLAERFQQDFYDHLASEAMLNPNGKISELQEIETAVRKDAKTAKGKKDSKGEKSAIGPEQDAAKWLEREWLVRWLKIEPPLGEVDLRPYVFVAREKRILASATESNGLESLIETLMSNSDVAVRSVEPQVKALQLADATQVFATLLERVVRHGKFTTEPPGFGGLMIVAKHHPQFQTELLGLLSSADAKALGFWVVKGWNDIITEPLAVKQLQELLIRWASQNDNEQLKKLAAQAITTPRRGTR